MMDYDGPSRSVHSITTVTPRTTHRWDSRLLFRGRLLSRDGRVIRKVAMNSALHPARRGDAGSLAALRCLLA